MLAFLLSLADEKDHAKIEYLYNHFHDDMLRLAKSRLHRMGLPNYELDAEDAVQSAFMKITKYIHKVNFDAGEKALRAYVLKIVVNEANDVASDHRTFDDILDYSERLEDGDFFGELRIHSRCADVVEAIKRIDERYSIPFSLRYGDEMTVPEIAALLGLPEKTVYTRLERAKKLLLEELKGEGDYGSER